MKEPDRGTEFQFLVDHKDGDSLDQDEDMIDEKSKSFSVNSLDPEQIPWLPEVVQEYLPPVETKKIQMVIPTSKKEDSEKLMTIAKQFASHRYSWSDLRMAQNSGMNLYVLMKLMQGQPH